MAKVTGLNPSATMTPKQALLSVLDLAEGGCVEEILIVGHDCEGELFVRSSRMTRRDALWLAEQLRLYALESD